MTYDLGEGHRASAIATAVPVVVATRPGRMKIIHRNRRSAS